MNYILDARKYLPDFLHKSPIMLNIMDCITALISDEQPIFSEIKAATDDMLYRCRDYSKLTYQAKLNIIKELGFEYITDVLNFTDARLTSLLTFFELIYSLKGKEEGLRLCLDHILNVSIKNDPVSLNTKEQSITITASYLSDALGEIVPEDFTINLQFYKKEDEEVDKTTGYGKGELIFSDKRLYFDQVIKNSFPDNTPITYILAIENIEDGYHLYLKEVLDSNDSVDNLFSFNLNQLTDANNELKEAYHISKLNIINPKTWTPDNQLAIYTYTPWDRMEPQGQPLTAELSVIANEFLDEKTNKKLVNFVRSYILPWVKVDVIAVVDAGKLYISPLRVFYDMLEQHINIANSDCVDIAIYDESYYDKDLNGISRYYGTEISYGPGEVDRNTFEKVNTEIKVRKYNSEDKTYDDITEQCEIFIGTYREYFDESRQKIVRQIDFEETNIKEVEKFMPIVVRIIYNEEVKQFNYIPNGDRSGNNARIVTFN